MLLLLNPRRTRTNMKLLQLVWIFLLSLCGQSAVVQIQVKEDDEAVLSCSFGTTNIENKKFDWRKDEDGKATDVFFYSERKPQPDPKFGNRVSHFPDQLRFGNASIKITKAETSDSGTYKCYHIPDVRIPQPELLSTISLTVDRILKPRPEIEGAAPKPSVRILAQTKDWSLLQCEVLGAFPKPEVVWTGSDGKTLPADKPDVTKGEGNKYDTVLNVTVTKTDHYTCVATQMNISHQINYTTFVHFSEETKPEKSSIVVPVVVAVVLSVLVTAIVVGGLAFAVGRRSKSRPGGPTSGQRNGSEGAPLHAT